MYSCYYVTGATGFLGGETVRALLARGARVRVLVMPNDPLAAQVPSKAQVFYGDVTDKSAVERWLSNCGADCCVIHCAGIISIASRAGEVMRRVNLGGTRNIIDAFHKSGGGKLVYISSVHAIPEPPCGGAISEIKDFSEEKVIGAYGKVKAAATAAVLSAAAAGLNISVVHPSGIIGPGDSACGSMTSMIISYCRGRLPAKVAGGYDFVDVRDVAQGIIDCADKGEAGECYILSGHYISIRDMLTELQSITGGKKISLCLPLGAAKLIAPLLERLSKKPYFTPYSVRVLGSNGIFSNEKAARELGFSPRGIRETLTDTVRWLISSGTIPQRRIIPPNS